MLYRSYPDVGVDSSSSGAGACGDLSLETTAARGGAGAPPSNTAPANCNEGGPPSQILCAGVDSLYLSYRGRLRGDIARKLDRKKEQAASDDAGSELLAQLQLGEGTFEVLGHGRGKFQYVLKDDRFSIQLSNRPQSQLPVAYCQISSALLLAEGPEAASEALRGVLEQLIESDDWWASVSRCDVFVDATAPFNLGEIRRGDWVCRARRIQEFGTVNHCTGFVFGGGGDLSARVYDKTEEIKTSGKEYMKTVWYEAGWDLKQTVIRTEFQLRGPALKSLEFGNLDQLINDTGALWRYCTTEWLRLAIPDGDDTTRSRWGTHPGWRFIAENGFAGDSKARRIDVPASNGVPGDETIYSRHVSVLSHWMAKYNITDPDRAVDDLHARCTRHHESLFFVRDEGFDEHVQRKAAFKAKKWNKRFGNVVAKDEAAHGEALRKEYQRAKRNERDKSDEWPHDWDVVIPGLDEDER